MKPLIEAGIALLIVYLFIQYRQGEAPGANLLAPIQGTTQDSFLEDPGAASSDFEGGGSNFYGTAPPSAPKISMPKCGCG